MFYLPGDSVLNITPAQGAIVAVIGALGLLGINLLQVSQEPQVGLMPEDQQPFYEAGMSAEGAETEVPCELVPRQGVEELRVVCPPVVTIEIIDVRSANPPVGDPYQFDFRTPDLALPQRNKEFVK